MMATLGLAKEQIDAEQSQRPANGVGVAPGFREPANKHLGKVGGLIK